MPLPSLRWPTAKLRSFSCSHALRLSASVLASRHCGVCVVAGVRGGTDVGSQSTDTIKLNFIGHGCADRAGIEAAGHSQVLKRNLVVLVEFERRSLGGINRSLGRSGQRALKRCVNYNVRLHQAIAALSYGEIHADTIAVPARNDDLYGTLVKRRRKQRDAPNQFSDCRRQSPPARSIRLPSSHYGSQGPPIRTMRIRRTTPLNGCQSLPSEFLARRTKRESRP